MSEWVCVRCHETFEHGDGQDAIVDVFGGDEGVCLECSDETDGEGDDE